MDAKVVWKQGLSFNGSSDSGFNVALGATLEVGGDDDGFRPMELIAIGLAGCTAMDVISILKKKKQLFDAFEVRLHAERAEQHPKVFTEFMIEYIVRGRGVSREAVERAVQLSAETYCPAQAMFKQIAPMQLKITMEE